MLGRPAARVIETFVEHDDRTGRQAAAEVFEDRAGRRVKVAVDVQKGNRLWVRSNELSDDCLRE
jgi:hypothetical protein